MGLFSRKPNIEKLKAKRDIKGLIKARKHDDYDVSRYAESALVDIVDDCEAEGDIETLIKIFTSDKEMRMTVVEVFTDGTIKDERVIEPFITALKDEEAGEWLRMDLISTLGKIGNKRAVEPLIEVLRKDPDGSMRKLAAEALGEIGDKRAIKPLEKSLKDEEAGEAAKNALKKIRKGVKKEEKEEEKKYRYTNPNLMARAEKDAMAKEDLKEAVETLASIYEESGGPRFLGLGNYIAGKQDACLMVEKYLRGEKGYSMDDLQDRQQYCGGRLGEDLHRGSYEILSWAIDRLLSE